MSRPLNFVLQLMKIHGYKCSVLISSYTVPLTSLATSTNLPLHTHYCVKLNYIPPQFWWLVFAFFPQIEAWKGNYIAAVATPAPEMMELAKWLESNVPEQSTSSTYILFINAFLVINCSELLCYRYCPWWLPLGKHGIWSNRGEPFIPYPVDWVTLSVL